MNKDVFPTRFWKEWLAADEDKRIKILQRTIVARELMDYRLVLLKNTKISMKFIREMTARELNEFIEDLENVRVERKP
jgi:hypothetical protein